MNPDTIYWMRSWSNTRSTFPGILLRLRNVHRDGDAYCCLIPRMSRWPGHRSMSISHTSDPGLICTFWNLRLGPKPVPHHPHSPGTAPSRPMPIICRSYPGFRLVQVSGPLPPQDRRCCAAGQNASQTYPGREVGSQFTECSASPPSLALPRKPTFPIPREEQALTGRTAPRVPDLAAFLTLSRANSKNYTFVLPGKFMSPMDYLAL